MEYSGELLSLLQSLELQRINELKKIAFIFSIIILIGILFFIKFRSNFLIFLVLGFVILLGNYYILNENYKDRVKTVLLPNIIDNIDPDFSYRKATILNKKTINNWKLFSHQIDELYQNGSISSSLVSFSFMKLESANIDTEEGRHESKRFDGVIVKIDLKNGVDQSYLISTKNRATPEFEGGDFLNSAHMGLKLSKDLSEKRALYSEDGICSISDEILEKIEKFTVAIQKDNFVVFDKNTLYILVDGISENYTISLMSSIKSQGIIKSYATMIYEVKKLSNDL